MLSRKIAFGCSLKRFYCMAPRGIKVLNVAEKNDAAKNIAELLSGGRVNRVSVSIDLN